MMSINRHVVCIYPSCNSTPARGGDYCPKHARRASKIGGRNRLKRRQANIFPPRFPARCRVRETLRRLAGLANVAGVGDADLVRLVELELRP